MDLGCHNWTLLCKSIFHLNFCNSIFDYLFCFISFLFSMDTITWSPFLAHWNMLECPMRLDFVLPTLPTILARYCCITNKYKISVAKNIKNVFLTCLWVAWSGSADLGSPCSCIHRWRLDGLGRIWATLVQTEDFPISQVALFYVSLILLD